MRLLSLPFYLLIVMRLIRGLYLFSPPGDPVLAMEIAANEKSQAQFCPSTGRQYD